jgi:hypothetical protein
MINILISRNDIIMVIIVIVIIAILYFIFNSSAKENFADTNVIDLSNVNSMDDKTAINTLAQISKSLMSGGGLTIPGDVNITGKTRIGSDTTITGKTTIGGDTNITGKTTIGGDTNITGKTTIGGDTNITGKTTINGATMDLSGNLTVTSITIGGVNGKYTLTYDSTDKALKISNGVDTSATPVKLTLGDKCKLQAEANGDTSTLWTSGHIWANKNIYTNNTVQASELIAGNVLTKHDGMYKIGGGKIFNF